MSASLICDVDCLESRLVFSSSHATSELVSLLWYGQPVSNLHFWGVGVGLFVGGREVFLLSRLEDLGFGLESIGGSAQLRYSLE